MPAPLVEDGVEYTDGTKATVEQMARDVTTFLAWAAEPNLEQRKSMGIKVILFLIVLLGLTIAVKKRIWADVH
jgi:ubiquinol-cytochrome c reductase cytochrome c1 subunit